MTARSGIEKMKFFIFLLISLLVQTAICDIPNLRVKRDGDRSKEEQFYSSENSKPIDTSVSHKNGKQRDAPALFANYAKKPVGNTKNNNKTHDDITSKTVSVPADNLNKTTHITDTEQFNNEDHTTFNTGALVRGFLVFVGLSILVMAYIVFRSFRLSKTRAQMVRKYGVLTHRQDVEMRPLPLEEEDDEDTTVFDASNVLPNNAQHQNT